MWGVLVTMCTNVLRYLLAPKASEASKGAFYLFQLVVIVIPERGYCVSIGCAIGGLQKSHESIRSGPTF